MFLNCDTTLYIKIYNNNSRQDTACKGSLSPLIHSLLSAVLDKWFLCISSALHGKSCTTSFVYPPRSPLVDAYKLCR